MEALGTLPSTPSQLQNLKHSILLVWWQFESKPIGVLLAYWFSLCFTILWVDSLKTLRKNKNQLKTNWFVYNCHQTPKQSYWGMEASGTLPPTHPPSSQSTLSHLQNLKNIIWGVGGNLKATKSLFIVLLVFLMFYNALSGQFENLKGGNKKNNEFVCLKTATNPPKTIFLGYRSLGEPPIHPPTLLSMHPFPSPESQVYLFFRLVAV